MLCIHTVISHLLHLSLSESRAGHDVKPVSQGHVDQFIPVTNTGLTFPQIPSAGRRGSSRNQSPKRSKHCWVRGTQRTDVRVSPVQPAPCGHLSSCLRRRYSSGTAWCCWAPLLPPGDAQHRPQRAFSQTQRPFSPSSP